MSTKCSLYYDKQLHVFQEIFDEKNVYFELENKEIEFKFNMTLKQFACAVGSFDFESFAKQAKITDEQIEKYVLETISARTQNKNCFTALYYIPVYGDCDSPVEEQIAKGVSYYKKKRDEIKKIYDEIQLHRKNTFYQFGLEDLI
jgi:hypothetical protein